MTDLKVAGQSIGVASWIYNTYGGAVVDSGTNIFLLPHQGTISSFSSSSSSNFDMMEFYYL
jgi:hypothetical protein